MRHAIVAAAALAASLVATAGAFAGSPYGDGGGQEIRRPMASGATWVRAPRPMKREVSSRAAAQYKTGN